MYFRLNPECYFVRGKKLGAIYDIIEEKIYHLNENETELLTSTEKNNIVLENSDFIKELINLRLGNYYSKPVYIQKLRAGPSRMYDNDNLSPPKLYRAFIEINNTCHRDCWYCGINGIMRSLGCMGCNKWSETAYSLSLEKWEKIIEDIVNLNCKTLFIKGADLTIEWEKTKHIVEYCQGKFDNIYITIHEESYSKKIHEFLKSKAKVIVQTENTNFKIDEENIIPLIVTSENGLNTEALVDLIIDNNISKPKTHFKKIIPNIDVFKFSENLKYHPCLGHSITICYDGNVIPCPMFRTHSLGNIINKSLHDIFKSENDNIHKIWKTNLDKVEKCSNCEFRYTCNDCRALEEAITGNILGKEICNYDPETGTWLGD